MAKKVTSKRVASTASKVLRGKGTVKGHKSARVRKGVDVAIDLYREALKELEKY